MKRFSAARRLVSIGVGAALLASCGTSATMPHGGAATAAASSAVHGIQVPVTAKDGIYVSEDTGQLDRTIFGYRVKNRMNRGPICTVKTGASGNISVDSKGNLMVSTGDGGAGLYVFQGPGMCGAELGMIPTDGATFDAASNDAASGKIVIGNFETFGTTGVSGDISICTLAGGCSTKLTNAKMFEVVAVALARNGDCWGSAYDYRSNPSLTYFKHCAGSGQTATGFVNRGPGGLDIDEHGNLLSIDLRNQGLYVYHGCNPTCKLVGGLFPFKGFTTYGHLNNASTAFVGADSQYGQADVYAYSPTALTYRYSFNSGLSQQNGVTGAAYDPRSKE